jgi:hypothetical protein
MNTSVTTFVPLRLARRGAPLVDTAQRKPAPPLLKAIGLALIGSSNSTTAPTPASRNWHNAKAVTSPRSAGLCTSG